MKDTYRQKLKYMVSLMAREGGVLKADFRKCLKTPPKRLLESLDKIGIKYKEVGTRRTTLLLKMNEREALNLIDDYDDSDFAKKFDYTEVLSEMSKRLLTAPEICKMLKIKSNTYQNVIIYLTKMYMIYEDEDDDSRVGLLTI